MKFAYLIHTFPLYSLTFIVEEIEELRKLGCNITIFSVKPPKINEYPENFQYLQQQTKYILPFNVFTLLKRNLFTLFTKPKAYIKTLYFILSRPNQNLISRVKSLLYFIEAVYFYPMYKASGCGHLHVHFMFGGATIALVLHKLFGINYSVTAHGTDILVNKHLLGEKILNSRFVRIATQYNANILNQFPDVSNSGKLFLLSFGIDTNSIHNTLPIDIKKPTTTIKIINVGRFVWQKNHLLLIDAINILKQQGYNFTLDIIGDGELRAEIEQSIDAKNLSSYIHLLGALPRQEVFKHMAQADIFVLSSVSEGSPIVLLEAMSCKVAIVAPYLTGIPEIIEHDKTGLLFEVGNAEDLADKLSTLLINTKKRQQLAESANEVVLNQYNARQKYQCLFDKLKENY